MTPHIWGKLISGGFLKVVIDPLYLGTIHTCLHVLLASKEEKAKWLRQQEVTWSLATRLFLTGENPGHFIFCE